MASKIIVDQLEKTGGTLTPLTLPSVDGTVGQYLKNDGSGGLGWVAPPVAGLSYASQWRINTQLSVSGTEPGTILSANWETPAAAEIPGEIGSATPMVVDSTSGAWTFPATGVWFVEFSCVMKSNTNNHMVNLYLFTTQDTASSWQRAAIMDRYNETNYTPPMYINYLVNIANVTTHKVRFSAGTDSNSSELMANTSSNLAYASFIKLGDAS